VGADPALLVHGDCADALRALAARSSVPALLDALRVVKDATLALEANVSPRLVLEHALLALVPPAAA